MSLFHGLRQLITPLATVSQFAEKGTLTHDEFVTAGDALSQKCKTWEWQTGDKSRAFSFLPKDRQFLITRNVPSLRRANAYALSDAKEQNIETDDGEGGWTETHVGKQSAAAAAAAATDMDAGVADIDAPAATAAAAADHKSTAAAATTAASSNSAAPATAAMSALAISDHFRAPPPVEDVPDIDSFEDENLLENDPGALKPAAAPAPTPAPAATAAPAAAGNKSGAKAAPTAPDAKAPRMMTATEPEDNIVKTRTYDISITYDKYWYTPRVYLFGYDEHRQPLTPEQIMEDISADHANKTVTVEPHPHTGIPQLFIHPCKHAHVMKRIVDQLTLGAAQVAADKKPAGTATATAAAPAAAKAPATGATTAAAPAPAVKIEQYLFLFLKFISSVIPTIEYDYTVTSG